MQSEHINTIQQYRTASIFFGKPISNVWIDLFCKLDVCDIKPMCCWIQVTVSRCMGFQYSTISKHAHAPSRNLHVSVLNGEPAINISADSTCSSFFSAPSAADIWLNLKLTGALADDSQSKTPFLVSATELRSSCQTWSFIYFEFLTIMNLIRKSLCINYMCWLICLEA